MAGGNPTPRSIVESWNGSAWTEVGDINTGRFNGIGFGTQPFGIICGGTPNGSDISGNTEDWNGASWSEVSDLNTSRQQGSPGGIATAGLFSGGNTSGGGTSLTAATEEWNQGNTIKTVDTD
jgi:hypothetical protein